MPEIVTIASNAVTAKLHEPSREAKLLVQELLSYQVSGFENTSAFKSGTWDGRSSFFDFRTGTFPAGFVIWLTAGLRKHGYEVRHVRNPLPALQGEEHPKVDDFGDDPRYDYQPETVRRLTQHGQIIAQIATGGGKSRIAKLAYKRIGLPTLFLTTRGILMYQMKESFEAMGTPVSVLGDGQFGHTVVGEDGIERSAVKKMCVGMVQTLAQRLEEKTVEGEMQRWMDARLEKEVKASKALKDKLLRAGVPWVKLEAQVKALDKKLENERPDPKLLRAEIVAKVDLHMRERAKTIQLLSKFGLVILEEAHESSGNSYFEILRHCTNAHYRLALTATPFMKDDQEANMRLMACSGPIAIKVTEKMLIDRGILARPYFKIIPMKVKAQNLSPRTSWQAAYRLGIVENEWRNAMAVAECVRMAKMGMTSMVLVQQVAHGADIEAMMRAAGLRVEFIKGEDDHAGRKAALQRLAAGQIDVLIGTNILDVGVDVPAVGHVCLLGGGKAQVALRQRIGRGLRAKKTGPNVCFITDFADDYNVHLKAHAQQRLAIIKGTEGFAENVLEGGRDFDFAALGIAANDSQQRAAA